MARKQVVFIMTDTTRWDMLGCYGNGAMKTPELDRLAEEGVRYNRAFSCQPVCGPARGAIFTGRYPHSNGSFTNCIPLWSGVKTMGEYLQPHGVHTAYIGKWHLDGGDYFGNGRCPEGYDPEYWYDMRNYLEELSPEDRKRSRKLDVCYENGGIEPEFTFGYRITERALDFLEKGKDEDFCLTVSYDEPHHPYLCPEPFASMYDDYEIPVDPSYLDDLENKPLFERLWAGDCLTEDKTDIKVPRASLFLGCNSWADHEIGRVLAKIRETCPDAMVIYTSDHGAALHSHSLSGKGPSVYEAIAHIPMIIKGGAFMNAPAGATYDSVTSHIDLLPTVLDYFGVRIPGELNGMSMRSIVEHPGSEKLRDEVFVEFHRYEQDHDGFGGLQFMRAAVSDRYKLALHLLDRDELFDCEKDPYELENLIEDPAYEEVRNHLHDSILEMMNVTRDPFRGYQWKCRSWRKDAVPEWECDGYTRQKRTEPGELRELDYDTGLPITEFTRVKKVNGRIPEGKR